MMRTESRLPLRKLAALYFLLQGIGGAFWWITLWRWPRSRQWFLAEQAPDATLFAFAVPDILLYACGSLVCAYVLSTRKPWGWTALCIHTGASVYAGLYCWNLFWLSPNTWPGALLMTPAVVVTPTLVWLLRFELTKGDDHQTLPSGP